MRQRVVRPAIGKASANSSSGSLSPMKKKQIISLVVVAAILGALVYFQFRSWQTFDWAKFRQYTGGVSLWHIGAGVGLIYLAYVLRAIRWAIFLEAHRTHQLPAADRAADHRLCRPGTIWPRRRVCPPLPDRAQGEAHLHLAACGVDGGALLRPRLGPPADGRLSSPSRAEPSPRFCCRRCTAECMLAARNAGHKLPLALAALVVLALLFFVLKRASGRAAMALRARLLCLQARLQHHSRRQFLRATGRGFAVHVADDRRSLHRSSARLSADSRERLRRSVWGAASGSHEHHEARRRAGGDGLQHVWARWCSCPEGLAARNWR